MPLPQPNDATAYESAAANDDTKSPPTFLMKRNRQPDLTPQAERIIGQNPPFIISILPPNPMPQKGITNL